jgi:hypothetical protein
LDPWCQQYNYYDHLISCFLLWCLFNSHGPKTLWLLLIPRLWRSSWIATTWQVYNSRSIRWGISSTGNVIEWGHSSRRDKETYKINLKLQARYEGPYKIVEKVNAVVYVAEIDGVKKRIHAINMKPMVNSPRPRGPRRAETWSNFQRGIRWVDLFRS